MPSIHAPLTWALLLASTTTPALAANLSNLHVDTLPEVVNGPSLSTHMSVTCYANRSLPLGKPGLGSGLMSRDFFAPRWTYDILVDDAGPDADYYSIQDALDAASNGDRILVCPGTYNERIDIEVDVELVSLGGAKITIIDASGTGDGTVVDMRANALLEGFTITGATADNICYYGGGIYVGGMNSGHLTPVIRHNRILDNVACKVGGIYVAGGQQTTNAALIENNLILNNRAHTTNAGGISLHCGSSIGTTVRNNVLAYNEGNQTTGGIEEIGTGTCNSDIRNNILFANTGNGSSAIRLRGTSTAEYNAAFANTSDSLPGTGNVTSDPAFVDVTDFELSSGSPCIDAGDPDPTYDDTDGTRNDMGAYGGAEGGW